MTTVTATQLAQKLGLSRGRISQMVAGGQLNGCWQGEGRARRFDLNKSLAALGQRLDPGQMMGNGAQTRAVLKDEAEGVGGELPLNKPGQGLGATRIPDEDPDRYTMARTLKAEEEARRLKRQNAEAEGQYLLASEAQLTIQKLIAQEVAEFEQVLRRGARVIADELGVDFKTARQLLIETWRSHRATRANALAKDAEQASLNETEQAEDI